MKAMLERVVVDRVDIVPTIAKMKAWCRPREIKLRRVRVKLTKRFGKTMKVMLERIVVDRVRCVARGKVEIKGWRPTAAVRERKSFDATWEEIERRVLSGRRFNG